MSSLCLPDAWLRYFDDPLLVLVLAAYRDALKPFQDGYAPYSERACAARTRLPRKTVRKKKHELIERYQVLSVLPARNGESEHLRIEWRRLAELVEIEVEAGSKDPGQADRSKKRGQNTPLSFSEPGEIYPAFTEERGQNAPLPGSKDPAFTDASLLLLGSSSELASSPKNQTEENREVAEAILDAIERSRLTELGTQPLDRATLANLSKAVLDLSSFAERKNALEFIEAKCRDYQRHPGKAQSWGLLVYAVQQLNLKKKPPMKEEPSFDMRALGASKSLR